MNGYDDDDSNSLLGETQVEIFFVKFIKEEHNIPLGLFDEISENGGKSSKLEIKHYYYHTGHICIVKKSNSNWRCKWKCQSIKKNINDEDT